LSYWGVAALYTICMIESPHFI